MGMETKKYLLEVLSDGAFSIEMKKLAIQMKEVVVFGDRQMNFRFKDPGLEKISAKAIKEIPMMMGERDILKVSELLPGITSESKEAIAHYPEIIREITAALQECGRRLSVFLSRRRRQAEMDRKRNYIELYIPHLAIGLKDILDLSSKEEQSVVTRLRGLLERTHLET